MQNLALHKAHVLIYQAYSFLEITAYILKPSLSSQCSLVQSLVRDFVCISFVRLTYLLVQSQTKPMETKPLMKLRKRLHQLKRPGLGLAFYVIIRALRRILSLIKKNTFHCVFLAKEVKTWPIPCWMAWSDRNDSSDMMVWFSMAKDLYQV